MTAQKPDLYDALQRLHLAAGSPSYRKIAADSGRRMSPATVHNLLTKATVPTWPVLSAIIGALGGVPADFREAWDEVCTRSRAARTVPHYMPGAVLSEHRTADMTRAAAIALARCGINELDCHGWPRPR